MNKHLEHYRRTGKLTMLEKMIRGAMGKAFVVKHYKNKSIMTKFPDMTKIIASKGQRECRDLFKDAVAFAKAAIADPQKKYSWKKRLKVPLDRVFNAVISLYMNTAKKGLKVKNVISCATVKADGSEGLKIKCYWVKIPLQLLGVLIEIPREVDIGLKVG